MNQKPPSDRNEDTSDKRNTRQVPVNFKPALWWTAEKNVQTVDDLFREIPRRAPKAASMVRVIYLIGAHRFQEHTLFLELFPNLEQIYLFEPIPDFAQFLTAITARLDYVKVFQYAITDFDGTADFHITNNYESSSLLELEKHREVYPDIHKSLTINVQCRKLDTVISEHGLRSPDLLFIDVQGAEYKVITAISAHNLGKIKLIYTEASIIELYKGARNLTEIRDYLDRDFYFIGFSPQDNRVRSHGNALFFNRALADTLPEMNCKDSDDQQPPCDEDDECFPTYSLDDSAVRCFWKAKQERIDEYITRCTIDDAGYINKGYRISVLITSYNSEEFIEECLGDLEAQETADTTEIIFIDAFSPQGERAIVRKFQDRYSNIRYVRTPERIGIYASWNLAARMARGEYFTTFSTNDRLWRKAHEVMSRALDNNPDVMLVYGDTYITNTPHEQFGKFTIPVTSLQQLKWPAYKYQDLLAVCMIGPNPMWRRKVHERIGYWDDRFEAIGDQDFFLRIGEIFPMLHLDFYTGLYWWTADAVSVKGVTPWIENHVVRMRCWHRYRLRMGRPPYFVPEQEVVNNCDQLFRSGIQALNFGNFQEAKTLFNQALEKHANHSLSITGLGLFSMLSGNKGQALELFLRSAILNPLNVENIKYLVFCSRQAKKLLAIFPFLNEIMDIQQNSDLEGFILNLD
jgi:FkbM family methyltransferase